jgi:hypothetical protein
VIWGLAARRAFLLPFLLAFLLDLREALDLRLAFLLDLREALDFLLDLRETDLRLDFLLDFLEDLDLRLLPPS